MSSKMSNQSSSQGIALGILGNLSGNTRVNGQEEDAECGRIHAQKTNSKPLDGYGQSSDLTRTPETQAAGDLENESVVFRRLTKSLSTVGRCGLEASDLRGSPAHGRALASPHLQSRLKSLIDGPSEQRYNSACFWGRVAR